MTMDWRDLHKHQAARGAGFYFTALTYSQHLWQRDLTARALLAADRALLVELQSDEPVLTSWPLPYRALRWIMTHGSAESLVGNPRVHYQHLAGRIGEPRAAQRRARAWAAWHLARLAHPEWPGDPRHDVHEPDAAEIEDGLAQHGLTGEPALWRAACEST